ncbi:hypothetical protein RHGRI_025647 [Rhododendron griersonianum]|uniref:Putative plant transposon protein domain-containing protein n=1 Tax=Rhododendron griersonianum TaxID=479676 RepID=A0AAV6ITC7_9ERIC|nr:hypothetical protein RHGRI_025647 [Rhododendron griersonianum]
MAGGSSSRTAPNGPKPWRRPSESRVGYKFFVNDVARASYTETYSQKAANLCERNVNLSDLDSMGFDAQFKARGWTGLCSGHVYANPEMVREFFSNVGDVNSEKGYFFTTVRKVKLRFSIESICELLKMPRVFDAQWPCDTSITPPRSEVIRELTDGLITHIDDIPSGIMSPHYRMLNKIVCSLIEPNDHSHSVNFPRACLLYAIGRGYSIDLASKIWWQIYVYATRAPGTAGLPFQSLLTRFMLDKDVPELDNEIPFTPKGAISSKTERLSKAQVTFLANAKPPKFIPTPEYPPLEAAFAPLHPPPGYNPPWNVNVHAPACDTPSCLAPMAVEAPAPPMVALTPPPPPPLTPPPPPPPPPEWVESLQCHFDKVHLQLDEFATHFEAFDTQLLKIDDYNAQFSGSFSGLRNDMTYLATQINGMAAQLKRLEARLALDYSSPADEMEADDEDGSDA